MADTNITFSKEQAAEICRLLGVEELEGQRIRNLTSLEGQKYFSATDLERILTTLVETSFVDHKQEAFKGLRQYLRHFN